MFLIVLKALLYFSDIVTEIVEWNLFERLLEEHYLLMNKHFKNGQYVNFKNACFFFFNM